MSNVNRVGFMGDSPTRYTAESFPRGEPELVVKAHAAKEATVTALEDHEPLLGCALVPAQFFRRVLDGAESAVVRRRDHDGNPIVGPALALKRRHVKFVKRAVPEP